MRLEQFTTHHRLCYHGRFDAIIRYKSVSVMDLYFNPLFLKIPVLPLLFILYQFFNLFEEMLYF